MPVDTERKTKPHHIVVGSADITLNLSRDLADEDLQEIFEAFRKVSLFNCLKAAPVTPPDAPFGPPSTYETKGGDAKTRRDMADEMWDRGASAKLKEGGPYRRDDAFTFDSPPEEPQEEKSTYPMPDLDPLVEAAKRLASEAATAFGSILRKALEDL